MHRSFRIFVCSLLVSLAGASVAADKAFRAGAATIDISPPKLPAIIAGGFLEGRATQINDRLHARCIVLDDGKSRIAFAIVDTCMMTRSLIDEAKELAGRSCGIAVDHMMVSATHTHSAPAAMACLGTRLDKDYAAFLPGKIAEGIIAAARNLQPAKIGWASIDDWEHTHNRRWIRRPETAVVDPFGDKTGLANMHPGYLSRDIIGPSGPVDPGLSVVSIQSLDGKPLALLANYSQHYFGSPAVSADYYGHFCRHVARLLGQPGDGIGPFVCAMSQGTSGDLMWMDYGSPKKTFTTDSYAEAVAKYAVQALKDIEYHDSAPLAIVEKKLELKYRVPDAARLDWARPIAARIKDDLAKDKQEVYAKEAVILHERQRTELKLQAIRIGGLSISTLPNEVYALTGLKLKAQSPMDAHFNIELANGAEGYIPPPEQHTLGGYTTWPARTAGLEVQAEPKIVETLLGALEDATGRKRRPMKDDHGPYAKAIIEARPMCYWRLNEADGRMARNAIASAPDARITDGVVWYLPGVGSGTGTGSGERLTGSAFSGPEQINRAAHFAGGEMTVKIDNLGDESAIALWFWLGEASGASERSGELVALSDSERIIARQSAAHHVWLTSANEGTAESGRDLRADDWHFAVINRARGRVAVHVDGAAKPSLEFAATSSGQAGALRFGKGLQGKLDEVAVFNRALAASEIAALWAISGIEEKRASEAAGRANAEKGAAARAKPPGFAPGYTDATSRTSEVPPPGQGLDSEPLSPAESLKKLHLREGFQASLVASEPQVLDPVAFDWDDKGRLWVVEMADYPLGMDGNGKPGGRVRRLEDADGDGRFEKSTLFADGLSFPNGILTWRDGVLVTAAPDILFLRDTNGDGRSDEASVLFTGFSTGNQQLRVNGLRWGMDGWVYCAAGAHHANYNKDTYIESKRTGAKVALGARDFRINPDTGELDPQTGPSQFGRCRDDWGHWFGVQNSKPLWHYVLQDHYLRRSPDVIPPDPVRLLYPLNPPVHPASAPEKRYHSFNQSGRYTSACGIEVYRGGALFGDGKTHAFTCEPFHNLFQHHLLQDDGVSFKSVTDTDGKTSDFFASEDRWCRPVMVRTGPDGAIYVADMYRYMIEHPQFLPQNGKDELLPFYRRGEDKGRIWRVSRPGRAVITPALATGADQLEALSSPNGWVRDKAQMKLLWDKPGDVAGRLAALATQAVLPQTRAQAGWTAHLLGAMTPRLCERLLADPSPRVREQGLIIAERFADDAALLSAMGAMARDPDAKVRLQLACSLGAFKGRAAAAALATLLEHDAGDEAVVGMALVSTGSQVAALLKPEIVARLNPASQSFASLARLVLGSKDENLTARFIEAAAVTGDKVRLDQLQRLRGMLDAMAGSDLPLEALRRSAATPALSRQLAAIDGSLGRIEAGISDAGHVIDPGLDGVAVSVLSMDASRTGRMLQLARRWLDPPAGIEAQRLAMKVIGATRPTDAVETLTADWASRTPQARQEIINLLLSHGAWTRGLLALVKGGAIAAGAFDAQQRASLLQHPSKAIAAQAAALLATAGTPTRAAVMEKFKTALSLAGDAGRGKQVFAVTGCIACHQLDGTGLPVGPDLRSVVSHVPEKLLSSILDPSAVIEPGFTAYHGTLKSGEQLYGIVATETSGSITMRLPGNVLRPVLRSEIDGMKSTQSSLMPDGLEALFTPQSLADLIAYLKVPK